MLKNESDFLEGLIVCCCLIAILGALVNFIGALL